MLTLAQRNTVRAAVVADQTANGFKQAGDAYSLGLWLNGDSATTVWRTEAPTTAIIDAIAWANYTPNDAPDNTATYTNRALLAQTKQMNLQLMLQGRQSLDCSKANLRSGLRDAVIAVPTGAGGANTSPGGASGVTVLTTCTRLAKRVESILAAGPQTTGTVTANVLTFEGSVDDSDTAWLVSN